MKNLRFEIEHDIKDRIDNSQKSILLVGNIGSGKSFVLDNIKKYRPKNKLLVDGTIKLNEDINILDYNIFNLYHVCLIIKKILSRINYSVSIRYFIKFDTYIEKMLEQIKYMVMTNSYIYNDFVTVDLYNDPDLLLKELFYLINKHLYIEDIILLIDNFDEVNYSNSNYQLFLYEKLRNYFQLVLTISDENIINNQKILDELSADNEIIKIDYSSNLESVKEILEIEVEKILRTRKIYYLEYQLKKVLDDETILLMIEKTNGNLFDMLNSVRYLYRHIDELSKETYQLFVLNYIDKVINKEPIISGIIPQKRILHIKNKH